MREATSFVPDGPRWETLEGRPAPEPHLRRSGARLLLGVAGNRAQNIDDGPTKRKNSQVPKGAPSNKAESCAAMSCGDACRAARRPWSTVSSETRLDHVARSRPTRIGQANSSTKLLPALRRPRRYSRRDGGSRLVVVATGHAIEQSLAFPGVGQPETGRARSTAAGLAPPNASLYVGSRTRPAMDALNLPALLDDRGPGAARRAGAPLHGRGVRAAYRALVRGGDV